MLVRFTKGPPAAEADTLTCVRPDGSTSTQPMPRQDILPHDAFHFVIECALIRPANSIASVKMKISTPSTAFGTSGAGRGLVTTRRGAERRGDTAGT